MDTNEHRTVAYAHREPTIGWQIEAGGAEMAELSYEGNIYVNIHTYIYTYIYAYIYIYIHTHVCAGKSKPGAQRWLSCLMKVIYT